jgi:predicted RNase H-like nuclease
MRMIAGADGCPGGWVAAFAPEGAPGEARAAVFATLEELLAAIPGLAVLALDMPIGLPEQVGPGGRGPEAALRPHLGGRQSSVFSVPSRAAVYAESYPEACGIALATSDPPRKVSKQCFHLFPKIRAVDAALRGDPRLAALVHETHPEGAFMVMNGGRPLAEPKKVKSRPYPPGLEERRRLLAAAGLPRDLLESRPPRGAAFDDLLDACACLVTAGRILRGEARRFPAEPARDAHGLPIVIWA